MKKTFINNRLSKKSCGISASLSCKCVVLVIFVASVHARDFWKALSHANTC